jgi:hypothetical protein
MLWFFESFFPVVWIAFLVYWRIKAAGTKTTQRSEPALLGILRALAFLVVIVLLSTTRIPTRAKGNRNAGASRMPQTRDRIRQALHDSVRCQMKWGLEPGVE